LHLPQSLLTRTEISELMMVHKNIITPQANRPVMGIVQDSLTGVRKMTKRDVFLDKQMFMQLVMWLPSWDGRMPIPAIIQPKELWTGKQLFSLLIPDRINLRGFHAPHNDERNGSLNAEDTFVLVENGQLLSGIICKNTVGAKAGGFIHTIRLEYTDDIARQFYGNVQTVVNNWLLFDGMSIGIADTIANQSTISIIKEVLIQAKSDTQEIIEQSHKCQLVPMPGNTIRQTFENRVNKVLNKARSKTGEAAELSLSEFNNFKSMSVAGSKGSNLNICQVVACVGQQNVEGKRIPFGFRNRTLPHFLQDDYGAESKGFVQNSYLRGLEPEELFFHAMGGREGLIDTAVKTAETGYIQRRLMKSMEAVSLRYDGTVRNSNGDMIQMRYGEDGMDGAAVEHQKIPLLKESNKTFENDHRFDPQRELTRSFLRKFVDDTIVNELSTSADAIRQLELEFEDLQITRNTMRGLFRTGENSALFPCNLPRLLWNARKQFKCDPRKPSDLDPLHVIDSVQKLMKRLVVYAGEDPISQFAQQASILSFGAYLKGTLSSKKVMIEHRLTREAFDWLIGEVEAKFNAGLAHPGEMVGALAAESLGEPITQMTLNTFHHAGVSAKNVTLGVPSLKEIINV